MARLARLAVGGWPHLVVQRVHDGQLMVRDDQDRATLLAGLRDAARATHVAIHAYSIAADRLLLLATPQDDAGLSLMMQAFGRRYVALYNRRHGRSGGLWAERFRATVIEPARYLLPCMVYVELHANGVATAAAAPEGGAVGARAGDRWSSVGAHLGQRSDTLISDHPLYWALGNTPFDRELAYRRLLDEGLGADQVSAIGAALHKAWALGGAAFLAELEKNSERRLRPLPRGRPRKAEVEAEASTVPSHD